MEWYVYYRNSSENKIKKFNVFNHSRFNDAVVKLLKKHTDKNEFSEAVRLELSYYFRSKYEYEVLVRPLSSFKEENEIKIDVYMQVMLNYNVFIDYIWSFKKPKRTRKPKDESRKEKEK